LHVPQEVPEVQQRLSDLQAQLDQLSLSLHLWRQSQDPLEPAGRRLFQLTERCAEALDRWSDTSDRLREQAATLTEVCTATANTTQTGFERAEVRLTALEEAFNRRITELSRELSAAAPAEPQPGEAMARGGKAWPLEDVVRIHNGLRQFPDEEGTPAAEPPPGAHRPVNRPPLQLPEEAASLRERVDSLERALTDSKAETREATERNERRASRTWRAAAAGGVLVLGSLGLFGWRMERQMSAAAGRAADAERRAQGATEAADQRIAAAREDAAKQIAQARETAAKAQTIADVLSAPDLVRYNLTGGGVTAPISAQVLWSRTRGLVFSGSRLPAPGGDFTYQIWLLTGDAPISAGVFVPDSNGRVTMAISDPPRLSRPLLGINVTVEPRGGRQVPSGETILARPQPTTQAKPTLENDALASERSADAR
jgi:hypothetical protein